MNISTDTQEVSSVCVALVFIVVEHPQEAYTHSVGVLISQQCLK